MADGAVPHGPAVGPVGVVVIGRNEGERLVACLRSLQGVPGPVVYVDSGSRDGSVASAAAAGRPSVALDPARPFSAARARNEGADWIAARHPDVRLVQFLDGDCTVAPGWLDAAAATLDGDARCAVVIGELQERRPEASPYNRMCALEWRSPPGEVRDFGALGGIMMVRHSVFAALGGFNPEVIAGEDSEFGVRVAAAGHTVRKIAAPMAVHDADIRAFSQWWRRAVRSGHAVGQRFGLNGRGPARDCARQRRSIVAWGIVLPAMIVGLAPFTGGWSALLASAYLVLAWRVARFRVARGDTRSDAWLYARFIVIGKFAEAVGLVRYHLARLRGRYRILEYK